MGWRRRKAGSGPTPWAGLSGDIACTAPAWGGGGARSAGGVGKIEKIRLLQKNLDQTAEDTEPYNQ